MKHATLLLTASLALLSAVVCPLHAAQLRGFGAINAVRLPAGQGMRFDCEDSAHAIQLIHKLASDMSASATVPTHWATVPMAGRRVPVLVRPGQGALLVLATGRAAFALTAQLAADATDADLANAFPAAAALVSNATLYDPAYVYPAYLDKWSNKGIGTWYSPYNPFDHDPKGLKDIVTPHFEYMQANKMAAHLSDWGPTRRETDYYINKYQVPYHMSHWHEWDADIARLDPFDLIQPGNTFTSYSDYYGQLSWGGDRLQQYRDWVYQNFMQADVQNPLLTDWDEPHGEIGPANYLFTNDFGPRNRAHFVKWLQDGQHYTLQSLGQAWYHDPKHYASWDKVQIPYDFSLYGLDKTSLQVDRTWRFHTGEIPTGFAAGYAKSTFDDSSWPKMQLPSGELGSLVEETHKRFWYRGTFTVTAAFLAAQKGPTYLNILPMSQSAGPNNPDRVWFNSVDLGGLSGAGGNPMMGCKEITGLLHAGVNHIAYSAAGEPSILGTFFISAKPFEPYPTKDSGINARYVDWIEYGNACTLEEETHTIKTMRGTDPNRPIKIMAAGPRDLFDPMMADYGCFLHNTGDEAFYVPWDRKLGYPYGLRTSAEPSASMVHEEPFKRWFGWFTFSGLNAFDNFIDIEAMMYTPVAPLWKENFPYLHLANRYNMKHPELGLFWSSKNARLNTGGKGGLSYSFDMGRGDFQSLAYSQAYFDEPGLHRNLANGYKVLWDCGTWAMSRETVRDIKRYVEQGGTYVALQETGRHTFTEKDAWPIEDLTGFKVTQVRPMGGFLAILDDQPIFTKLRGKNYLNEGRSVDYSGYNYADTCVTLKPIAAGTVPLARYRDGAIAIGLRKLGKGRVIVIGSPFWRDSYDQAGMWWPGERQNEFVSDLMNGLGVPSDVPADTTKVWRDRFIANNGTEEYLLLFNPYKDSQSFTADFTASFPFTQVFDPKTSKPVAADIKGNTAKLSVTLAPMETRILSVQSQRPVADAVSDWYADLAVTWKPSLPGSTVEYPDLPRYYVDFAPGVGKMVDKASVTPSRLASLSASATAEDGWNPRLDMIRAAYSGLAATQDSAFVYRRVATVPKTWKAGDKYMLRLKVFGGFDGVVYLNGQQVATSKQVNDARESGVDVSSAIRFDAPNLLVVQANQNGFAGAPDLWRQPAVKGTVSLDGAWNVLRDENQGTAQVTLPGDFTGLWATRDVQVPAAWKGSHVFLRMDWGYQAPGRLAVNEKTFFYQTDTPKYMDVTPWIKFGRPNRILIQTQSGAHSWTPGTVTIKSSQLEQTAHL